jgi:hypothetical protein
MNYALHSDLSCGEGEAAPTDSPNNLNGGVIATRS